MMKTGRRRITAAALAIAALAISGCTATLPWPEAASGDPKPTTSTRPSTKPKPSPTPHNAPLPPADAALDPFGSPHIWLSNDYANGVDEPAHFDGQVCYIDPESYTVVVSEDWDSLVAYSPDGKKLWSIPDAQCAYASFGELPPVITLKAGIATFDVKNGSTRVVAKADSSFVKVVAGDPERNIWVTEVDSYSSTTTDQKMVIIQDEKALWEMPLPFVDDEDNYLRCRIVDTDSLACDSGPNLAVFSLTTGKTIHTATIEGSNYIEWGRDFYSSYDEDYDLEAFDFTGAKVEIENTISTIPYSDVYYPLADVQKKIDYQDMPAAITHDGDTAALYDGDLVTPDGVKLGKRGTYIDSVSGDGRVFLMSGSDKAVLIDSAGVILLTIDEKDSFVYQQNGFVTMVDDTYDGFRVWFPVASD